MKKWLSLFLAAALTLSLAACGGSGTSGSAPAASEPTAAGEPGSEAAGSTPADGSAAGEAPAAPSGDAIVIGGLAPLTGGVSQYGIASSNGSKLAVEEINAAGGINGRPIEFALEDEQGDPTEALNAYNLLVQNKGIVALVGDVTTKPSIAVAQKAVQDNIPMITPTGTGAAITETGANIFRACFTDPYQGQLMAHFAKDELSAAKAAILYDTGDDYSQGIADAFEEEAKAIGLEVVAKEGYASGASDFNAQLTKIKEVAPDVIMTPCYYEDAAQITVQANSLGITAAFLGSDGWDSVLGQLDESNQGVLDNSYYCSQYPMSAPGPELQKFIENYVAAYGEDAPLNMFATLGYEAMHMMAKAIENAGSEDSDAITAAMKELVYPSIAGYDLSFVNSNDPVRETNIIQFKEGAEAVWGVFGFDK